MVRPELTPLGLGGAPAGNLHQLVSDEDVEGAVDAAWDAGIRYFDTAPHYGLGLSERRIGRALAKRSGQDFTVSTKVGRILVPAPGPVTRPDPAGFVVPATHDRIWDFSRDGVLRSLEDSLDRLGLDRIDIVHLHDPDDHWEQAGGSALPTLVELRDQGVIGAVGVGMNQTAMPTRFVEEYDLDLVMCAGRYTLLDQSALDDLLPAALRRGVGIVIAGVYNSGLLATDRPREGATFDYVPAPAEMLRRTRQLAELCDAHGVTLPQAALAFVRAHPAVVATVVGLQDADQVAQTVQRAAVQVPDGLWSDLRSAGLLPERAPTPDGHLTTRTGGVEATTTSGGPSHDHHRTPHDDPTRP
jgi:D-threo-aldose 1-dehydrogenase